jgi:hypothetical protein
MAISTTLEYASPDDLLLDPKNPRLGRHNIEANLSQEDILEVMKNWTLEELAVSFIESGFWPQEALIVVEERIGKAKRRVVVEGNRRLAALRLLWAARKGSPPSSPKWKEIASQGNEAAFNRLKQIPYLVASKRTDVSAYIGFRHVTGIKQWAPAEKAEYIALLIENEGMSYEQVMRKIGSKTPTVRQNYISYRLLLQMEGSDKVSIGRVEEKFSVLFLSLRSEGTQKYLSIDIEADPKKAKAPVPKSKLNQLANFALWLFGDEKNEPIVKDSRQVDRFGEILESDAAVEYLERTDKPNFETAFRIAGGAESGIVRLLDSASDDVRQALATAHLHKKSGPVLKSVRRLSLDVKQLLDVFPSVRREVLEEE